MHFYFMTLRRQDSCQKFDERQSFLILSLDPYPYFVNAFFENFRSNFRVPILIFRFAQKSSLKIQVMESMQKEKKCQKVTFRGGENPSKMTMNGKVVFFKLYAIFATPKSASQAPLGYFELSKKIIHAEVGHLTEPCIIICSFP